MDMFKDTSRYFDDILMIENPDVDKHISAIFLK